LTHFPGSLENSMYIPSEFEYGRWGQTLDCTPQVRQISEGTVYV
jgi:hypothetical protein